MASFESALVGRVPRKNNSGLLDAPGLPPEVHIANELATGATA